MALGLPVAVGLALLLGWGLSLPVLLPPFQGLRSSYPLVADITHSQNQEFSSSYPVREPATPEHAAAQGWLKAQLVDLGYEVHSSPFTVRVASQNLPAENLWVTRPGRHPQVILITTAFDTLPADNPAFSADATGIALLIASARTWANLTPEYTLVFLFADASAYGPAWGAQQFLANTNLPLAAVLEVAPQGQQPTLEYAGFQRGYTPPWLRLMSEILWADMGLAVTAPDPLTEFGQRITPLALSNTGVYLRADLPAVRWRVPVAATNEAANANVEALGWVVSLLDAIPLADLQRPTWFAQGWRFTAGRYVPDGVMVLLACILFLPLWVATVWEWRMQRPRWGTLFPEFGVIVGLLVTVLDGYAVAYMLINQGLLPRYEQFPATPGDAFLLQPTAWAALLIYGFMALFGWFIFRRFYGAARRNVLVFTPHRRLMLLSLLALLTFVSVWVNPYAAIAIWLLPAYLWWWIAPRPGRLGLALNLYLVLLGCLPLILWVAQWDELRFGVWWWFLPLAVAYGTFSPLALLAGVLTLALALRFGLYGLRRSPPLLISHISKN